MALNKKSVFFTLIAILMASVLITSFAFYSTYRTKKNMFVVETRINTAERFIENFEQDIERALYIAGFRAILAAENNIIANGSYINDSKSVLEELVINGTLNKIKLNLTNESALINWFEKAKIQGSNIGIEMDYNLLDFNINQSDPWFVDFYVSMAFSINDAKGIASWTRNKSINTRVNIIEFEDPVYAIGTNGKSSRMINKRDLEATGMDNLKSFLNESSYRAYSDAPSFLMRLEGNFSASPYGIETLIDTNKLSLYSLPVYDRSSVDYIYFGEQNKTDYKIHNITDVYMPGFKLDAEHVNVYDVDDFKYN